MKVSLINPPSEEGYIRSGRWTRRTRANQQWFPIWLAYGHALLEREGHECDLIDAPPEMKSNRQVESRVVAFKPDTIAVYFGYDTSERDLAFADKLAEKHQVVLVGPWSYAMPDALSKTENVGFMTFGEFDHTLLEIVERKEPSSIQGMAWRNNGEIEFNGFRPLVSPEELDRIPFVADVYKRFLNIHNYRQTSLRFPFVDLLGARGCAFHCSYCIWPKAMQQGTGYRKRSIRNVIEELWFIKNEMAEVKQIFFQDDILPPSRARKLSQAIIDEGLDICWGGYSRADLDRTSLEMMKKAGCRTLHVGYESPIQKYLDFIEKDLTAEKQLEFAKAVKELDMWTSATFMLFPMQTEEEIKATLEWAKRIRPKRMNFIQAQAYPHSPYAHQLLEIGDDGVMGFEEMREWEKWAFKEFHLKNPLFWWDVLTTPREWLNVVRDAMGLLGFLRS